MSTEKIYIDIKSINIEPDSNWWKNIYLKFLAKCGYLSIFEGYKFIILSDSDINSLKEKKDFVEFSGMKTSSIIGYKEDRIKDRNIEFFVRFLLPIDNFYLSLKSENGLIYFRDVKDNKLNISPLKFKILDDKKINISLKFTTLFTPNSVILMIIMTLISTMISILMTK